MKRMSIRWIIAGSIAVACFAVHFALFVYSYNTVTALQLTEGQRIENATYIMTTTLPLYAVTAGLFGLAFGLLLSKNRQSDK